MTHTTNTMALSFPLIFLFLQSGTVLKEDLLLVPVVNLMDVSKDDLVFSSHVIRNSLLFHPAHVALKKEHQTHQLKLQ